MRSGGSVYSDKYISRQPDVLFYKNGYQHSEWPVKLYVHYTSYSDF